MSIEDVKNAAAAMQSLAAAASFLIGGIWVYLKFVRQQEKYLNIEFSADIEIVGKQGGFWLAELSSTIENKGKSQHKMTDFDFDLFGITDDDRIEVDQRWAGQVNFPHEIAKGSFLPAKSSFFFIDPGTKARYSYIARIPENVTFAILHCNFKYSDERNYGHTAEKTIKVSSKRNEN